MVENGAQRIFQRRFRLDHSAIIGYGRAQPLALTGKLHRQSSAHSKADDAVNVALDELPCIQELTAGIDVLKGQPFMQFAHQSLGDLRISGYHASDAGVEIRNDDAVAFTGETGAQILDLRIQPPPFVQKYDAGVSAFFLRPKLDALDLHAL